MDNTERKKHLNYLVVELLLLFGCNYGYINGLLYIQPLIIYYFCYYLCIPGYLDFNYGYIDAQTLTNYICSSL